MSTYHNYVDIQSFMSTYQRYSSSWYNMTMSTCNDIYIHNIFFCQQINIIGIYKYSRRINKCRHTINISTYHHLCQHTKHIWIMISYHHTMHMRINNTKRTITILSQYIEHIHTFGIIIICVFISLNKRCIKMLRMNYNIWIS